MHVTMQVNPEPMQFKKLIECAGGIFVSKLPTKSEEVINYIWSLQCIAMERRYVQLFLFQGLYAVANPADKAAVTKLRKVERQILTKNDEILTLV